MDFIRGNMMHQLWGDLSLLDDEDLRFMESIARCTRENAELLKHPRRILGSPWRREPYGYACCEGDRGLIAIHDAQFAAERVWLRLDGAIGLKDAAHEVRWIYKSGSVKPDRHQIVSAGEQLEVALDSFEVCLAEIRPAGALATATTTSSGDVASRRPGPQRVHARLMQTSCVSLSWSDPDAAKRLARVVNGRTTPTNTPDVLAVGPDRSDERDRDIVQEKLAGSAVLAQRETASKLLVIARFDRDGIAWHHLAPFLITHVTATAGGEALKAKTTPRKMHEQAGGWSWILHEFDVPPGAGEIALSVDATHPKSVTVTPEVWHSDE
jgi:hypothetical protein